MKKLSRRNPTAQGQGNDSLLGNLRRVITTWQIIASYYCSASVPAVNPGVVSATATRLDANKALRGAREYRSFHGARVIRIGDG